MKYKTVLGFLIILGLFNNVNAADILNIWPNLKCLEVDKTDVGTVYFYYNPQTTEIINQLVDDPDVPATIIQVARIRLSPRDKNVYYVEYDGGTSCDPSFSIYKGLNNSGVKVFREFGLNLTVPGNSSIYISGHTNNMYDQRKKYDYSDGRIVEVIQPYYYVGIDSVTREPISLYNDKNKKNVVASLPKGSKVQVIINQKDYYLIKTEYGLVGWARLPVGRKTSIEKIYYAGD